MLKTRPRVAIWLSEPGAPAELDQRLDLEVGGFKSDFLSLMNEQGAKRAKKSANY